MSPGAGARAVSWACKACSLFHLQAFFKSLLQCYLQNKNAMRRRCRGNEVWSFPRSHCFFPVLVSTVPASEGSLLAVLMVVPIQSSLPRFRGRIALKSLLRKPDAWPLLKMSAAPPASQTRGRGMGNRMVPVGEY